MKTSTIITDIIMLQLAYNWVI